ncbi:hypothetical protein DBV15_11797 [Temnothorax longispinosus]|uniref:Uncharacterized protein n=1 Tax=Temnothorax longispinosus TaxID=300112 RepID=A0A4S2JXQ4_9HYME|nr:hypothetical protein DBV15_11797 [Temnothorax longispinosus]
MPRYRFACRRLVLGWRRMMDLPGLFYDYVPDDLSLLPRHYDGAGSYFARQFSRCLVDTCPRPRARRVVPEVVTGQGNVSGVVSTATQHESARRRLGFASGVVVACPDLLAAHLEVAAAGHGALVLAVVVEVAVVVVGLHQFDWKNGQLKTANTRAVLKDAPSETIARGIVTNAITIRCHFAAILGGAMKSEIKYSTYFTWRRQVIMVKRGRMNPLTMLIGDDCASSSYMGDLDYAPVTSVAHRSHISPENGMTPSAGIIIDHRVVTIDIIYTLVKPDYVVAALSQLGRIAGPDRTRCPISGLQTLLWSITN